MTTSSHDARMSFNRRHRRRHARSRSPGRRRHSRSRSPGRRRHTHARSRSPDRRRHARSRSPDRRRHTRSSSPSYNPGYDCSPEYSPTAPSYEPNSTYIPTIPPHNSVSPQYSPVSPQYSPTSPSYDCGPQYNSTDPYYKPMVHYALATKVNSSVASIKLFVAKEEVTDQPNDLLQHVVRYIADRMMILPCACILRLRDLKVSGVHELSEQIPGIGDKRKTGTAGGDELKKMQARILKWTSTLNYGDKQRVLQHYMSHPRQARILLGYHLVQSWQVRFANLWEIFLWTVDQEHRRGLPNKHLWYQAIGEAAAGFLSTFMECQVDVSLRCRVPRACLFSNTEFQICSLEQKDLVLVKVAVQRDACYQRYTPIVGSDMALLQQGIFVATGELTRQIHDHLTYFLPNELVSIMMEYY